MSMMSSAKRAQFQKKLPMYVSVDLVDYDVVDQEDVNPSLRWTSFANLDNIDQTQLFQCAQQFKIYGGTVKSLKKSVRKGVPVSQRAQLWFECSGGRTFLTKHPDIYDDNFKELAFPDPLPITPYESEVKISFDHLNEQGLVVLRKLLLMLHHEFPHIPACPLLPALASYFLLFMEGKECHACMSAILESIDNHYLDSSQREFAATLRTFQDLSKVLLKRIYRDVLITVINKKGEDKFVIFQDWILWIFKYLPSDIVIRIIDCFIVEGRKIFYRVGLAILILFHKHCLKNVKSAGVTTYSTDLDAIRNFVKHIPFSADVLLKKCFNISGLSKRAMVKYFERNRKLINQGKLRYQFDKSSEAVVVGPLPDKYSHIVEPKQWNQIWNMMADRYYIKVPILLFTSAEDGCSLQTFYNRADQHEPLILLVKTSNDEIFGAFLTASWNRRKKHPNLKYFGTGESYLFTLIPEEKKYVWCGKVESDRSLEDDEYFSNDDATNNSASADLDMNDKQQAFQQSHDKSLKNCPHYFMAGDDTCIVVGGGDHYGLWIDADLNKGCSAQCRTFLNKPLTSSTDGTFKCVCVELYALVDA